MKRSNFIEQVAKVIQYQDIISEASDPEKLYFKNVTQLHQNDDIVKQGFLQGVKNLFSKKNKVISQTLQKFIQKYKFAPIKRDGKTLVGTWAKYQGDYLLVLQGDLNALDENGSRTDFKGWQINLSVKQGEDPDEDVEGMTNIPFTVGKSTTEDQIAEFINSKIKKTLACQLTTTQNPPPSTEGEGGQQEEQEEGEYGEQSNSDSEEETTEQEQQVNTVQTIRQIVDKIPQDAFINPGNFYQIFVNDVKQEKKVPKEAKKKIAKSAKNFAVVMKKLQKDKQAGKYWKIVFGNFDNLSKLQFVD